MYRIKHASTGLYYSPGHPNLTVRGKVYQTAQNVLLSYPGDYVPVSGTKDSKMVKSTAGKIKWEPSIYQSTRVIAMIPKTEFIKEEL